VSREQLRGRRANIDAPGDSCGPVRRLPDVRIASRALAVPTRGPPDRDAADRRRSAL